ncbi:MAG: hypothetical protein AAGA71_12480 [Pseudomonadota bacterium]
MTVPSDDAVQADATIPLTALLGAVAEECRDAASDMQRLQHVLSEVSGQVGTTPSAAQSMALQDLDRLTQTLEALGKVTILAASCAPTQRIRAQDVQSAALESVATRLVARAAGRGDHEDQHRNQTVLF